MLRGRERSGATSYRVRPAYLFCFAGLKIQGLDLEAAEFLKYTAGMLEEVYRRLLVSAYTALDQGIIGDGKQPIRFEGFEGRPTLVRQR
jgi:hypothetical protein